MSEHNHRLRDGCRRGCPMHLWPASRPAPEPADQTRSCLGCGKPASEAPDLTATWWADYECCSLECTMRVESEPADQTRADVVLSEGEREALSTGYYDAETETDALAVVERILADRLAAERAEHAAEVARANAGWRQSWGYVCEIARALGVNPDEGHPMDAVDRLTNRAEAAEATMETLRGRLDHQRDAFCWHDPEGQYRAMHARAEAAEATVARVRALADHAEDHGAVDETDEPWIEVAVIRAALDGERP